MLYVILRLCIVILAVIVILVPFSVSILSQINRYATNVHIIFDQRCCYKKEGKINYYQFKTLKMEHFKNDVECLGFHVNHLKNFHTIKFVNKFILKNMSEKTCPNGVLRI